MSVQNRIQRDFEIEESSRVHWAEMWDTHFHDCYEFYYLVQGEVTYFIEESIYLVKKGDVILIPPQTIHKTKPSQNPKHKRILIYLKPAFIHCFLEDNPKLLDCFHHTHLRLSLQKQQRTLQILEQMQQEYEGPQAPDRVLLKALMGELLVLLNRAVKAQALPVEIQTVGVVAERILEVVRYINNAYAQELTLTVLAEKFYMNPTYLSRSFKSVTGFNFAEYLKKVRIKQAVLLLGGTKQNITEISFAVGFNSSNHFCKVFKEVMGMSPLKFRKSE